MPKKHASLCPQGERYRARDVCICARPPPNLAKQPDSQRPINTTLRHSVSRTNVAWFLLVQSLTAMGGKGAVSMTHTQSEVAINARLLKIGLEVFPVYGDEKSGWSVDPGDLYPQMPIWFRYRSLDELFFALVNLNISPEGQA
jgi:hypothetical protein